MYSPDHQRRVRMARRHTGAGGLRCVFGSLVETAKGPRGSEVVAVASSPCGLDLGRLLATIMRLRGIDPEADRWPEGRSKEEPLFLGDNGKRMASSSGGKTASMLLVFTSSSTPTPHPHSTPLSSPSSIGIGGADRFIAGHSAAAAAAAGAWAFGRWAWACPLVHAM